MAENPSISMYCKPLFWALISLINLGTPGGGPEMYTSARSNRGTLAGVTSCRRKDCPFHHLHQSPYCRWLILTSQIIPVLHTIDGSGCIGRPIPEMLAQPLPNLSSLLI